MNAADPRIGSQIAGYRVESLLARGGMGEVYLALQTFPERRVALKLLPHDLAGDAAFRERFIRESNAAAAVEHPCIVPVYGAGESDGELWMAMRYIDGTDLRTLLDRERRLEPARAVTICSQVADALEEAHEHGLVHRDVKPGNILVAGRDRAYLTDFGLIRRSEIETDLTKTGQFMGTVDYVAPEQIKGEQVDGRADVYSLGCVLFECLTGDRPFRRDTEIATLYAHLEDARPHSSAEAQDIPGELDDVIAKGIARRADERFQTAAEMARALRESVGVSHTESPPRRGLRFALFAAAAVVVGLLVVALLPDRGDRNEPTHSGTAQHVVLKEGLLAFDPGTGQVSRPVPIRFDPSRNGISSPLVQGEGGLWTIDRQGLVEVDPKTGIATTVEVPEAQGAALLEISGLTVGPGAVWLTYGADHALRLDPFTFRSRDIKIPIEHACRSCSGGSTVFATGSIEASPTSVWVLMSDDSVVRIDAINDVVDGRIRGVSGQAMALGADKLWVANALTSTMTPVNVRTGRPGMALHVPGNISSFAVGEGGVWILDRGAGTVTLVDPRTGNVQSIGIGPGGTSIVVAYDAIWVTNPSLHMVTRIDPLTRMTDTFDVHAPVTTSVAEPVSGMLWLVADQSAVA